MKNLSLLSRLFVLAALLLFSCQKPKVQYENPFQDPGLPVEERIDNLLSLMNLEEKVQCLGTRPNIPRLGVVGTGHIEGLHGIAKGGPSNWGRRGRIIPTTTFPQSIGLAQTWNRSTLKKVGEVTSTEMRYMVQYPDYQEEGLVLRAPNADIGRDIRWGRNEECYGEDAFFNGTLVASFINGVQGDDPKYWRAASLMKHFLANSNEDTRTFSSSNFDERLFHEYYSHPFRMGIQEGGSQAFMAAYNSVNGIPMTIHPMLKDICMNEWGLNGIICTDGGAYKLLISDHKYYPDEATAAVGCIKAGINQFLDRYNEGVIQALDKGLLTETDIDETLRGVFRVMIKLGQLDPDEMVPYKQIGKKGEPEPWKSELHKQAVLKATQESIVLLKNENHFLPLNRTLKTIAVAGILADTVMLDWYSGTPPYRITLLQALKEKLGNQVEILYSRNNDEAVSNAEKADAVIVIVGNDPVGGIDLEWAKVDLPSYGREAVDRRSIELEEEELVKRLYEVNPNTVLVLMSSFPYAINWSDENLPAILHMTHNSQETGTALADVLFGDFNPAGRLVQTWLKSLADLPDMMDYNIRNNRTYMYFKGDALYLFGFGLSYTSFEYGNLKINKKKFKSGGTIRVQFFLHNTGEVAGDEVPQLYVKHIASKVERPILELKGFDRVGLKPGEKKTIRINVPVESLACWDSIQHRFVVEPGEVELLIGASSEDIRLKTVVELL